MAANFMTIFAVCFIILQSALLTSASLDCPVEFPDDGMCKCGYVPYGPSKKLIYVTNCTNTGFDNTMMLKKLPSETEILIFVGNEVKDLPINIFGQDIVYEKLHTIDLSNNHIQSIKGRTFHNVANVTKLVLNDNDLYIINKDHHPRMFSNFVNLKELHLRNAFTEKVKAGKYLNNLAEIFGNSTLTHLKVLNMENNEISSIYHGEFCSLPSLQELYLGENHLKDLSLNFSCHKDLKMLDVGSNLISHFSDATLKSLETVRNNSHLVVNLTANPFKCDCHMVQTFLWMRTAQLKLVNKERLYCLEGFPPIIGKPLASIQVDELQCVPVIKTTDYRHSGSLISLTVLLIAVSVILMVILVKHRVVVGNSMRRVLYPIRSKFHYVTLNGRATMDV